MKRAQRKIIFLVIICTLATIFAAYLALKIEAETIQNWLSTLGIWGPVIYILIYTAFTLLILPSTALNLMGGALFGAWLGTFWTTIAAILAAVVAFLFTRNFNQTRIIHRLNNHLSSLDKELQQGGLFYIAAIRLLPILPYGLVNYAAGLTSIKFRDYFLGTLIGTLPGVLPFVLLGSTGSTALRTGDVLPVLIPLCLIGLLLGSSTWYRHNRSRSSRFKGR